MKIFALGVMAVLLTRTDATAQRSSPDISERLLGKPLQLRGFWMEDSLQFDRAGSIVGKATEGSFTESAFDAKKVSLNGGHLRIEGQRVGLAFNADGTVRRVPIFTKGGFHKSPEVVAIDIDGERDPDFSKELDAIFASSLAELAPSLRPYWQPFARKHFLNIDPPGASLASAGRRIGGEVKPPKVLYVVDPTFSQLAREAKLSGTTILSLAVDVNGDPHQIVITRPLGLGLDEHAIAAVRRYHFAPATQGGVPVEVNLTIQVNFAIQQD